MRSLVIIFFLAIFGIANAVEPNNNMIDNSAEAKLIELLDETKSFVANFEQKILVNNKPISDITIGTMYSQKPNLFRWEVDSPYKNLIILNGNKLINYDIDLEQVTIQRFSNAAGSTPFFLSGSSDSLKDDYNISDIICSESNFNKSNHCFNLIPKKPGESFQLIKLGFLNTQLAEIELLDQLDQTTIIKFNNSKVDVPLSRELFKLDIPEGVDVLESD